MQSDRDATSRAGLHSLATFGEAITKFERQLRGLEEADLIDQDDMPTEEEKANEDDDPDVDNAGSEAHGFDPSLAFQSYLPEEESGDDNAPDESVSGAYGYEDYSSEMDVDEDELFSDDTSDESSIDEDGDDER